MQDCQSRRIRGTEKCARPAGHYGLHRNTKKAPPKWGITSTIQWGDNEQQ